MSPARVDQWRTCFQRTENKHAKNRGEMIKPWFILRNYSHLMVQSVIACSPVIGPFHTPLCLKIQIIGME